MVDSDSHFIDDPLTVVNCDLCFDGIGLDPDFQEWTILNGHFPLNSD